DHRRVAHGQVEIPVARKVRGRQRVWIGARGVTLGHGLKRAVAVAQEHTYLPPARKHEIRDAVAVEIPYHQEAAYRIASGGAEGAIALAEQDREPAVVHRQVGNAVAVDVPHGRNAGARVILYRLEGAVAVAQQDAHPARIRRNTKTLDHGEISETIAIEVLHRHRGKGADCVIAGRLEGAVAVPQQDTERAAHLTDGPVAAHHQVG